MNLPNSFSSLKIGLSEAIPKIKSLVLLWPSIFFLYKIPTIEIFSKSIVKPNFVQRKYFKVEF